MIIPLAVIGCGGANSQTEPASRPDTLIRRGQDDGTATASARRLLIAMIDDYKIRSTSEANAAQQRANGTQLATAALLEELGRPGLSERERAEKNREIDRLRKQYNREMAPVLAFYNELEHRLKGAENVLERKDREIERMRQELAGILERKGGNERREILRVQGEFDRRLKELMPKTE
jgi:hypothetical protein